MSDCGWAGAAEGFMDFLNGTSEKVFGPGHELRMARADAEASLIKARSEIEIAKLKSDARYRLEATEVVRQMNLTAIAEKAKGLRTTTGTLRDPDWALAFIENAKDAVSPTLQDIWARLLAGEMDAPGSCSKRTMQMVNCLDRNEALLIQETCRRVCVIENDERGPQAVLTVFVERVEKNSEGHTRQTRVYEDDPPDRKKIEKQLFDCGFLSAEDSKFAFLGEGYLDYRYFLSGSSLRTVRMGNRLITAEAQQPRLIFPSRREVTSTPSITNLPAKIELDSWKLTAEGEQLYRAFAVAHDFDVFDRIAQGLRAAGLNHTVTHE